MQILHPLESRRRSRRGKWLKIVAWLVVAGAAGLAWQFRDRALNHYHVWKQQRALAQAKAFIAANDPADAQVALQVAYAAVPGSVDAYRAAADMLEHVGSPQALRLRQYVLQTLPSSLEDRLAMISCALEFRDYNAARDGLAGLTPAQAAQPPALAAALTFALLTENRPVADALFDRLRKLYPQNDDYRVAQDILHLKSPRSAVADAARADLESSASNPKYATQIRRELMADAMLRRDLAAAKRWAELMANDPKATLADRLHEANLELLVDKAPFDAVFARIGPSAADNALDATEFARWLLVQGKTAEADKWLSGLPLELRDSIAVRAVQAEVAVQLKDWERLDSLLAAGAWGPINPDSLNLAMSARLLGSRNDVALQHEVWDEAIQAAGGNLGALTALARLASIWHFETESEHTLWAIVRAFPDQVWASEVLFTYYHSRGDTANLRAVLTVLANSNAAVPRYRHDLALLTILAEPSDGWSPSKDTLQDLYRSDPSNPFYATSYAFALAQSNRGSEALAVVNRMPPDQRDYSPRLPYLAYIYGASKDRSDFERVNALAQSRNISLLPEERQLFTAAREALDSRPLALPPIAKPLFGPNSNSKS
jgi:hypothetical protein